MASRSSVRTPLTLSVFEDIFPSIMLCPLKFDKEPRHWVIDMYAWRGTSASLSRYWRNKLIRVHMYAAISHHPGMYASLLQCQRKDFK